jgi:hypothetical protein
LTPAGRDRRCLPAQQRGSFITDQTLFVDGGAALGKAMF